MEEIIILELVRFFEAVRYKKPVILCINNTLKYYAQKYNEMVWSFNDFEEFLSKQDELCEFMRKTSSKSFENVMNDYTDDVVTKGILKSFRTIKGIIWVFI